jgi:chromosome segregation ATPase
MGTDLFTSHRGAGVIGTVLALLVFGGFSALYVLVFMEGGSGPSVESEIRADAVSLERLRQRVADTEARYEATRGFGPINNELERVRIRLETAREWRDEKEEEKAAAERSVRDAAAALAEYKSAYRQSARASMVGREMDRLVTEEGREFTDVKVTGIDPIRMQIRHSEGITGVPLAELPAAIREYLQHDEKETRAAIAAESESRARVRSNSQVARLRLRIAELERRRKAETEAAGEARSLHARNTRALDTLRRRIQSKEEELIATRRAAKQGGISNAPQVREQIRSLESTLARTRQSLPQLLAEVGRHEAKAEQFDQRLAEARAELAEAVETSGEEEAAAEDEVAADGEPAD